MKKYFIGIDIGGTKTAIGIVDKDGNIVAKNTIDSGKFKDIRTCPSYKDMVQDIAKETKEILTKADIDLSQVYGIGIGMPGIINGKSGVAELSHAFKLDNAPIRDEMKKYFDLPIQINNDAKCAALAEVYFGDEINSQNAVMITLGTGVGGGIIFDGSLYGGRFNASAEFSSLQVNSSHNGLNNTDSIENMAKRISNIFTILQPNEFIVYVDENSKMDSSLLKDFVSKLQNEINNLPIRIPSPKIKIKSQFELG